MVHNAIEYGMMESLAEGYRMLQEGPYKDLDLAAAGNLWQHGSIVASGLNRLSAEALSETRRFKDSKAPSPNPAKPAGHWKPPTN